LFSDSLNVTTPGYYSVQGLGISCNNPDTIFIDYDEAYIYVGSLPNNAFEFCQGDTIQLITETSSFILEGNYYWNTGAVGYNLTVTEGGQYYVGALTESGCVAASDIITITEFPFDNSISSSAQAICDNQPVLLSLDGNQEVFWNTGSNSESLLVTEPGNYFAYVSNGPCTGTTEIVTILQGVTPVVSGFAIEDTICSDDNPVLLIGAPPGGVWTGDGVVGSFLQPSEVVTGIQTCTYTFVNEEGCSGSEDVVVLVEPCNLIRIQESNGFLIFPNPVADAFFIQLVRSDSFEIQVYDIFGKIVHEGSYGGETTSIDAKSFASGVYSINCIFSNGERLIAQMIKL
jgi:hypothetical protein